MLSSYKTNNTSLLYFHISSMNFWIRRVLDKVFGGTKVDPRLIPPLLLHFSSSVPVLKNGAWFWRLFNENYYVVLLSLVYVKHSRHEIYQLFFGTVCQTNLYSTLQSGFSAEAFDSHSALPWAQNMPILPFGICQSCIWISCCATSAMHWL